MTTTAKPTKWETRYGKILRLEAILEERDLYSEYLEMAGSAAHAMIPPKTFAYTAKEADEYWAYARDELDDLGVKHRGV